MPITNLWVVTDLHPLETVLKKSRFIRDFYFVPTNDCLVALSGGPDSMMMALMCYHHCQKSNIPFQCIHIDHGMRPESAAEAQWLKQYCKSFFDVEIITAHQPLKGHSQAREFRYQALHTRGFKNIYLGHHQDDLNETFLIRLHRGSGLWGLCPMMKRSQSPWDTRVIFRRPFLNIPKQHIIDELYRYGVEYITDPSNENNRYERVFWRKHSDQFEISAGLLNNLSAWRSRICDQFKYVKTHDIYGYVTIPIEYWDTLTSMVQKYIVHRCAKWVRHMPVQINMNIPIQETLYGCRIKIHQNNMYIFRENRNIDIQGNVFDHRFVVKYSVKPYKNQPLDIKPNIPHFLWQGLPYRDGKIVCGTDECEFINRPL